MKFYILQVREMLGTPEFVSPEVKAVTLMIMMVMIVIIMLIITITLLTMINH